MAFRPFPYLHEFSVNFQLFVTRSLISIGIDIILHFLHVFMELALSIYSTCTLTKCIKNRATRTNNNKFTHVRKVLLEIRQLDDCGCVFFVLQIFFASMKFFSLVCSSPIYTDNCTDFCKICKKLSYKLKTEK